MDAVQPVTTGYVVGVIHEAKHQHVEWLHSSRDPII